MFLSHTHAMAIKLENKDNGKYTKVSFYDPNDTARHINTNIYKLEDINKLTAGFMSNNQEDIDYYFKTSQEIGAITSVDTTAENNCETYIDADINPILCSELARAGHFKSADLGRQINSRYTSDEIFDLYNNSELLGYAVSYNNAENIRYIIRSILDSPMNQEQKLKLLGSNLTKALSFNNSTIVTIICDAVLSSSVFSEQDKYLVLSQYAAYNGANGLLIAFRGNNPEAIRAFTKSVLTSNLTETTKEKMLLLTSPEMKNITSLSFIYSSPKSFHAFINTVKEFAPKKLKNKIFASHGFRFYDDKHNIFETITSKGIKEIKKQLASQPFLANYNNTYAKLQYITIQMLENAYERKDYKHITEFITALLANNKLSESEKQQMLNLDAYHILFIL